MDMKKSEAFIYHFVVFV